MTSSAVAFLFLVVCLLFVGWLSGWGKWGWGVQRAQTHTYIGASGRGKGGVVWCLVVNIRLQLHYICFLLLRKKFKK